MRALTLLGVVLVAGCGVGRGQGQEPPPAQVTLGGAAPTEYDPNWLGRGSTGRGASADGLELAAHGRYAVPPERALLRATVWVEATTRADVVRRAREIADTLRDALSGGERCEASVIDLTPPRAAGEQLFSEEATIRLDVILAGIDSVEARQQAIESCLARFEGAGARAAQIVVSDPLLTIDDPSAHREAILTRMLRDVRAVQSTDAPVTAPACRSNGTVSIVDRSLSEIALTVDLTCA